MIKLLNPDYVTGASGFIGSRLIKKLAEGAIPIPHQAIPGYELKGMNRFFFLSTYGNMFGQDDFCSMMESNIGNLGYILGTIATDKLPIHSFIYVSSSSVTLEHQTPYSRSKRAGEEMVLAAPVPGCIVRPYSVTGVGEQENHLIPKLIQSCMLGTEMPFDPTPVHDYVDVDDLTDYMVKLSDKGMTGIHEFGRGIPVSNFLVKEIVESHCGQKANLVIQKNMRPYDTNNWCCDNPPVDFPFKQLTTSVREMVDVYLANQE